MLELVDVRSGYGRSEVIHGVNLEVPSDSTLPACITVTVRA